MVREKRGADVGLLIATALLLACGILFIYDASFVRAGQASFTHYDPQFFLKRQIMWAFVGIFTLAVTMHLPYWKLERVVPTAMVLAFIMLVLVMTPLGLSSHGARRWLGYSWLRLQPSEFAKLAMVLFFSYWIATRQRRMRHLEGFLPPVLIMGLFGFLIAHEPDLGTALVLVFTGTLMLFIGGVRKRHLGLLGASGLMAVIYLILKEPYRLKRIYSWIDPYRDVQGSGYQVVHALIALGSGGPFGVGLGCGRQKYFYLPAEHTDYILGTIGEELGLVGTLLITGLFFFVVVRGLTIAHRTRDPFGSLMASGLSLLIGTSFLMNAGVVTKLLPSTGVPLPFISYGGSSLVLVMAVMGLLLNISQYPSAPEQTGRTGRDKVYEDTVNRRGNRRTHLSRDRYR